MVVTLDYSGSTGATDFTIYRANPHPIELFRKTYRGISGSLAETFVSYRHIITVEFAPLEYDKSLITWMYGFLKGSTRTVTINATTYDVTITGSSLSFDFQEGTFFGDSFTLTFAERTMSYITDTASTRIFKPLNGLTGEGISSETMSLYCNTVDEIGVEAVKVDLKFVNYDKEDLSYSYRHVIMIDTGPIYKIALKTWLDEFVQWGLKQIDTTSFYPDGQVYDVVFEGESIDWQLCDGINDVVSAVLVFKEITPRTVVETLAASPVYDEAIFGETTFG